MGADIWIRQDEPGKARPDFTPDPLPLYPQPDDSSYPFGKGGLGVNGDRDL